MSTKLAFLFVAPPAVRGKHRCVIAMDGVDLIVTGVKDYAEAAEEARALVAEGCSGIELCAGFGAAGVAAVAAAAGPGIPVGVVRFDSHPAFGFASGDTLFSRTA